MKVKNRLECLILARKITKRYKNKIPKVYTIDFYYKLITKYKCN